MEDTLSSYYTQISSKIRIPKEKIEQVADVAFEIEKRILTEESELSFKYQIEPDGVWVYAEEYFDVDELESFVRHIVNEMELDDIYVCSWSYSCSKMMIDSFGGGAFAIMRGIDTVWVDAADTARTLLMRELE